MLATNKASDGFTLLELIIAVAVMTTAITGFMMMLVSTGSLNRTSEETTLASLAASQKLEEILSSAFDDIDEYAGNFDVPPAGPYRGKLKKEDGGQAGTIVVTNTDINGYNAKIVTITVAWKNFNSRSENRQIQMSMMRIDQ